MSNVVCWYKRKFAACESAQSLVETALLIPVLLLLVFNAVNFSYFFFVAIELTSAPHMGVEYSIQGFATPSSLSLPMATPPSSGTDVSVSSLTYADLAGLGGSSNAQIQVCTAALGAQAAGQSSCLTTVTTKGSPSATPHIDPEPSAFILNQVDVWYTVSPLIPAKVFGLTLTPSATFHRSVSMRAMN
jgi:Flp pilus assembly protein TadG